MEKLLEVTTEESTDPEQHIVDTGKNTDIAIDPKTEIQSPREDVISVFGEKIKITENDIRSRWKDAIPDDLVFDDKNWNFYKNLFQKDVAANHALERSSLDNKRTKDLLMKLQSDPKSVLKDPKLGIDARKVIEDLFMEMVEEDGLSPEEKEKRSLKQRAESAEKELQSRREREQEYKLKTELEKEFKQVSSGLEKELNNLKIPINYYTIKRGVEYYDRAKEDGYSKVPLDKIASLVADEYKEDLNNFVSNADVETIINFIGEKNIKKIREHELKKVKSVYNDVVIKPDRSIAKSKPKSIEEWRDMLNNGV